jgi:hypothetical protein
MPFWIDEFAVMARHRRMSTDVIAGTARHDGVLPRARRQPRTIAHSLLIHRKSTQSPLSSSGQQFLGLFKIAFGDAARRADDAAP